MPQTLEQRVEELEKTVADLEAQVGTTPREKRWERSTGVFANDPEYDSAMRLGREWREQQTCEKEVRALAGS